MADRHRGSDRGLRDVRSEGLRFGGAHADNHPGGGHARDAHRGLGVAPHGTLAPRARASRGRADCRGALFATHSWYVPPPPPPPPPTVAAEPVEPAKPVAPPLPFTYMGSYAPNGANPVFFLTQGDRVYDVHVGDTLEGGTYSVDAFTNGALIFTYKPLNQQQQLITGGAP